MSESDSSDSEIETRVEESKKETSFAELGINDVLCKACDRLKWKAPTPIQSEAIPHAMAGKDVIGLAETGSGKTGAFALPILHKLLETPQRMFALVMAPTRELAFQISETFEALGSVVGLKSAVLVGGVDIMSQSITLAKKPHVIIATPGRLVDHLEHTKGFSLSAVKFLVLDEADRILNMDFEAELTKILSVLPRGRTSLLFSATMTKKVAKLQRASLTDPVKVSVSSKYQTVEQLRQFYLFIPAKFKDVYLTYLVSDLAGQSMIIFCGTCVSVQRVTLYLRNLGFTAVPLNGQMSQDKRLGALNKFRGQTKSILVATDVASRGLDIPHVDVVVNYDIPTQSKDYVHRVGRTARAGRSGKSISLVTQYDVELYQRIEHLIGKKLPEYPTEKEEVLSLTDRVHEAVRLARTEISESDKRKIGAAKRKKSGGRDSMGVLTDGPKPPTSAATDDAESSFGIKPKLKRHKDKLGKN